MPRDGLMLGALWQSSVLFGSKVTFACSWRCISAVGAVGCSIAGVGDGMGEQPGQPDMPQHSHVSIAFRSSSPFKSSLFGSKVASTCS